jgi:hypothetical protein
MKNWTWLLVYAGQNSPIIILATSKQNHALNAWLILARLAFRALLDLNIYLAVLATVAVVLYYST